MSYGILSKLRDEDNLEELPVAKVDLEKRLARALKKHLEGAKEGAKASGFDEFDDGSYKAKLVKAELGESQSSDRLQVAFHWKFLSGEYKKKIKIDYQGAETEENLKWLLRIFDKLGYETDDVESVKDIEKILKELSKENPVCKIALKTNGEFQNVRILKAKDDDDEDEDDEDTDDDSGDDDDDDDDDDKKKKKKSKDDDDDESEDDEDDDEDDKKKKKKKKSSDDDDDDDSDDDDDDESEDDDDDKKKKKKKGKKEDDDDSDDEDEDDDDDGEDVELAAGSKVTYKFKGKKYEGTVLDVFPKSNEFRVETDDKKRRVNIDAIIDVEVPEEPKKKKKKKK